MQTGEMWFSKASLGSKMTPNDFICVDRVRLLSATVTVPMPYLLSVYNITVTSTAIVTVQFGTFSATGAPTNTTVWC